MERKKFQFFSCNSYNEKSKMIYEGWYTESDMEILSIGLAIGLRQHHKGAFVRVYEEIDGTSHLIRVQK